jgi:hypothetical protein
MLRRARTQIAFSALFGCVALPMASGAQASGDSACFDVHGRLAIWNGAPAVRIWPVGTRRELGVVAPDGDAAGDHLLPGPVATLIQAAPDHTVVFGDYRVCPLSPDKAGRMRIVFIARASRLRAERR